MYCIVLLAWLGNVQLPPSDCVGRYVTLQRCRREAERTARELTVDDQWALAVCRARPRSR